MTARGVWHEVECLECGIKFAVPDRKIRAGKGKFCSRSCSTKAQHRRHGHTTKDSLSPTYNTWALIIQRCTNPSNPKFSAYGGNGITVSERWMKFSNFLDDMGERPHGKSIGRYDTRRGFCKANCFWATPRERSSNIRTNRTYAFRGENLIIPEIARRLGVNKNTLAYRIHSGWPENNWGIGGSGEA